MKLLCPASGAKPAPLTPHPIQCIKKNQIPRSRSPLDKLGVARLRSDRPHTENLCGGRDALRYSRRDAGATFETYCPPAPPIPALKLKSWVLLSLAATVTV